MKLRNETALVTGVSGNRRPYVPAQLTDEGAAVTQTTDRQPATGV